MAEAAGGEFGRNDLAFGSRIFGARFGWIYDLTVDAKFRRRGIGRILLRGAYDHFKVCGISSIGLMVLIEGQSARELYESEGFREHSAYMSKELR